MKFNSTNYHCLFTLGWLKKASFENEEENQAYCRFCRKTLRAHCADLKKHAIKPTHKKVMESLNTKTQRTLESTCNINGYREEKVRDLKFAGFMSCKYSDNGSFK